MEDHRSLGGSSLELSTVVGRAISVRIGPQLGKSWEERSPTSWSQRTCSVRRSPPMWSRTFLSGYKMKADRCDWLVVS